MTVHTQKGKVITNAEWKIRYNEIFRERPKRFRKSKYQIKMLRGEAKQITYALHQ